MMKQARLAKRYLCIWLCEGPRGSGLHDKAGSLADDALAEDALADDALAEDSLAEDSLADDALADDEALDELAIWCQQFSPVVATDEAATNDTLLLEVTGLAHLFGGEERLARHIVQRFGRRGLTVQVAMADTIGAAWAVAHFGFQIVDCRLQIDASDDHHQSSIYNLKSAIPLTTALGPLPLAALRLPKTTLELLNGLGIRTVAQLSALPRDQLPARFGCQLLLRLDQATGRCEEALRAVHPPPSAAAEWLLESPTYRLDTIHEIVKQLLVKVTDQLAARGRGAMTVLCRLELQTGSSLEIPIGLYRPTAQPRHLADLAALQLEHLRLNEPVCSVHLVTTATALLETRQRELFDLQNTSIQAGRGKSGSSLFARPLIQLIDRLSNRLGRTAVSSPRLLRDAIPERAYRLQPLTGKKQPTGTRKVIAPRSASKKQPAALLRLRPLWLEPSPAALKVVAMVPDGRPLRFRWGANQYDIAEAMGPERIETGWWRRESPRQVRRDYYRVETTTGQRFWLFRRHDDGAWFLHGEFD